MPESPEMLVSEGEIVEVGPRVVALDTRRGPELDSVTAVRREMGKLYRLARRGKIKPEVGAKLNFMLMGILKALELEVIEHRITDIQHTLEGEP